MLTCQELVELLTDYLDGALPPDAHADLARHLAGCEGCTAFLAQLEATRGHLGQLPVDALSPATCRELLDVFRGAREQPEP